MTIMFQVDDLSQASPATVSRCGMVLLESAQLGHSCLIDSYKTDLEVLIEPKVVEKVIKMFHYIADLSLEFTRVNGKFPCAGNAPFLVNHIIRMIDCYMAAFRPKFADSEKIEIPGDIEDKLYNILIYTTIWGVGGCLDEFTRSKFDAFFKELINGDDVITKYNIDLGKDTKEKYPIVKIPNKLSDYDSLFDMYFDMEEMRWTHWDNTVTKYTIDKELTYLQLSIPTIDSIRMLHICETLMKNQKHVLLVGPTGTGKSV